VERIVQINNDSIILKQDLERTVNSFSSGTCESVLQKCAKAVEQQEEAIIKQGEVIKKQDEIINLQEEEVYRANEATDKAVVGGVGVSSLLLLLLLL
jgi:hypothetical protein